MSTAIINLSSLDGSNGFRLDGESEHDRSGYSVSSAGDVNGDGFDDVIVGTGRASTSYVVFGKAVGFDADINLSSLNGDDGFRVHGVATLGESGISIGNVGDINGDGVEDMIVKNVGYDLSYGGQVSHNYVVFGKTAGFSEDIDLTSLDGNDGFRMQGPGSNDGIERAGDINGDGFADVIVDSRALDSNGHHAGSSYVVLGGASGFDPVLDLSSLDGHNGFVVQAETGGQSDYTIHSAGDINGDGLADVIVGDPSADLHGNDSGSSYVVFGRTTGFDAVLDLSSLNGHTGFRLDGEEENDFSNGIASVGDINGDGFDDVIIDAPGANKTPNDYYYSSIGARYVVFGKAAGFDAQMDLSSLDGNNGFRLNGPHEAFNISGVGDINGDGFDDIFIESPTPTRTYSFHIGYVVLGKASGFNTEMDIDDLDGSNGFRLIASNANLDGYASLSSIDAGDVNGDGFGDLIVGVEVLGTTDSHSYVVLGKASGFPATLDLFGSDSSIGVRLEQEKAGDSRGLVRNAGDVNGDGFDDLIVGAWGADPNGSESGSSYVIFGRSEFHSDETIRGTPGDDILTGTVEKDRIEAGGGNDILDGRGGADLLLGEGGNDILQVADQDFQLADGGSGLDTLTLTGSGFNLNLTDFHDRINQIETIDLTGDGDNTLSFSLADFLALSDIADSLQTITVDGNAGDRVEVLTGNWTDGGTDQNYRVFMHNSATLRIDRAVDIDIVVEQGVFDLGTLDGRNGFRLDGEGELYGSGYSVSGAGDVNGDGFDDLIVGSPHASSNGYQSGSNYVVFGKASGFDAQMDLSSLDGDNGFRLDGEGELYGSGYSVSGAGDVNGDGFDDVIVGTGRANSSHVVFGKASGFGAKMNLSNLDGRNGFRLDGAEPYNFSGSSVSDAGDVNGDGFDDVIVGTGRANSSYVVFGKANGFDAALNLSSLNGRNGFRLDRLEPYNYFGLSVSGAGDVNGDGFDDLIVGDYSSKQNGEYSGSSYVVFGKAAGFDAQMNLSNLDGHNGFRLDGENEGDFSGRSVSSAGDVNGDGFGDLIIGSPHASSNGYQSGSNYVVFGKASGFDAQMDLSSLDGDNGFRLDGAARYDGSGKSVSGAGDINGDGFDDIVVSSGTYSYVVFGKASGFDAALNLDDLDGSNGVRLDGISFNKFSSRSVSGAGDVNGDGFDDLIVGVPEADPNGNVGSSYIVFGSRDFGQGGDGGGELPEIKGTEGEDTLKGSEAAEHFIAGDGNDNLLGLGGADIFDAGAGDDAIRIGDLTFASIDGGDGNDALHLAGSGLNLDLSVLGDQIHNIETICLYGRGDNTLTLTADSLLNLSDSTHTLKVHGNTGDHIVVQDSGWIDGGSQGFYHTYTHDDAVLLVGANVTVELV